MAPPLEAIGQEDGELIDPTSGWSLSPERQAEIAQLVHRGNRAAEEEFVRNFQRPVLHLLVVRTRDAESARDLTQEALLGSLTALRQGRLREPEKMAAFVARVARNTALKFVRSRQCAPLPLDDVAEPLAPSLDTLAESVEHGALISAALADLDGAERAVLDLTWRENFAPRQIAERLGVTSEVVRSRKSRALKKIVEHVRNSTRHTQNE